jgi:outer membrane immunogenic protein
MRSILMTCITAALTLAAAPAFSAEDWNGFHAAVSFGAAGDVDDDSDRFQFDTNLDGTFNDNVNTAAGANAFAPGFCDGVANDRTPDAGCIGNSSDNEFSIRLGYDWQSGDWVYGLLAEYAEPEVVDAVSAFSVTPARYTMIREIDNTMAIRGRLGMVLGERGLLYGTGGFARGSISNRFTTSNTVNSFANSGGSDADGTQIGFGYEHRLGTTFSLGLEYLLTSLDDEDYRVRAAGPAPATNPFILTNAAGTDFARSDDDLDFDSLRLTASYRF